MTALRLQTADCVLQDSIHYSCIHRNTHMQTHTHTQIPNNQKGQYENQGDSLIVFLTSRSTVIFFSHTNLYAYTIKTINNLSVNFVH